MEWCLLASITGIEGSAAVLVMVVAYCGAVDVRGLVSTENAFSKLCKVAFEQRNLCVLQLRRLQDRPVFTRLQCRSLMLQGQGAKSPAEYVHPGQPPAAPFCGCIPVPVLQNQSVFPGGIDLFAVQCVFMERCWCYQ